MKFFQIIIINEEKKHYAHKFNREGFRTKSVSLLLILFIHIFVVNFYNMIKDDNIVKLYNDYTLIIYTLIINTTDPDAEIIFR